MGRSVCGLERGSWGRGPGAETKLQGGTLSLYSPLGKAGRNGLASDLSSQQGSLTSPSRRGHSSEARISSAYSLHFLGVLN